MMNPEPQANRDLGKVVRVLVVDDSAFMSYLICKELSADPSIQVVGTARDGLVALQKIQELGPDVVTLDLEMPRMDGLTTLRRIMGENPMPVILLSSLTQEGAAETIKGLELGAVDFVAKPDAVRACSEASVWHQLIAKVKAAAGSNARMLARAPERAVLRADTVARRSWPVARSPKAPKILVIGSSTGGPRALAEVVPHLPADLPAAVLVVQHMPPGFTRSLAARLNEMSKLEVREAKDGDQAQAGLVLLAPGDFHMVVRKGARISLEKSPTLHGVRPAVDVTMESAVSAFGAATVGVILTGMGRDGTAGALAIRRAGGFVIAEDESTCAVYGMPRSAFEAGAVNKVAPLGQVAEAAIEAVYGLAEMAARRG